jgi:non-ribosomal peptide synthetase component F
MNIISTDIDLILTNNNIGYDDDIDLLGTVLVTSNHIAYITFTSGSTGAPKAVSNEISTIRPIIFFSRLKIQIRQRNFIEFVSLSTNIGAFSRNETLGQIAECSFEDHVLDILSIVMIGGTLIMLRPRGLLDLEYLSHIIEEKQITCMNSVPSLLHSLFHFVEQYKRHNTLKYMRSVNTGGM